MDAAGVIAQMHFGFEVVQHVEIGRAEAHLADTQRCHVERERQAEILRRRRGRSRGTGGCAPLDPPRTQLREREPQPGRAGTSMDRGAGPCRLLEPKVAGVEVDLDAVGREVAKQRAAHALRVHAGHEVEQPGAARGRAHGPADRATDAEQHEGECGDEDRAAARQPAGPMARGRRGLGCGLGGRTGFFAGGHELPRPENAMPTVMCRRNWFTSWPYARSSLSGPTGLRQRRPTP